MGFSPCHSENHSKTEFFRSLFSQVLIDLSGATEVVPDTKHKLLRSRPLDPNDQYPMEAPLSLCHPEEPTCLRQVKGAMNSTGHRGLDGCPMFALANVGRKSRATWISCYAALDRTACAPFRKERRMHCINATKSNRKSGGSPSNAFRRSRVRLFIRTGEVMGLLPTQGDEKCLPSDGHSPWKRHVPHCHLSIPITDPKWKRRPPPCHPERSRGTCSSTDLSGTCFSVFRAYPDFLPHSGWQRPRLRLFEKIDVGPSQRHRTQQEIRGSGVERSCGSPEVYWNRGG